MAPPPKQLMEELVEEILIRFPPDDPARLAHATLVCKLWCRLVCSVAFRRRFREFHRTAAPLLGLLYNDTYECEVSVTHDGSWVVQLQEDTAYFVPTTSFRPAHASKGRYLYSVMDARHGRVLLCSGIDDYICDLCIWDPITDEQRELPELPFDVQIAAVVCAAIAGGDCDHLDCHQGPQLVVAMSIQLDGMHLSVYSSDTGAWSKETVCEDPTANSHDIYNNLPGILVHSALYILFHFHDNNRTMNYEIVKFNLATQQVSMIHLPSKFRRWKQSILLMTDDDGGLGFVASVENKLELWSRVAGVDGDAGFVLTRVIDLPKVLPSGALMKKKPQVNGFADSGASRVLLIRTCDGLYTIEINSGQVRKLDNCCGDNYVVPYISFWTPTSSSIQH